MKDKLDKKKVAINMMLPVELYHELKDIASLTHTPLATFVREVLARYVIDRKEIEKKGKDHFKALKEVERLIKERNEEEDD